VTGLDAAERACAVADRSDLGRLIAAGPDLLSLLHRLSTADLKDLRPGEGRETVITSAKGRIVERLFVHHLGDDGVLLVAGPAGGPRVLAHLRRFTFAEDTGLSDVTEATCALALIGPGWAEAARKLGVPRIEPFGASAIDLSGIHAHAVRTNGFDADGLLVIAPRADEERVRSALVEAAAAEGGGAIDAETLEAWRILHGLPAAGHELTEERNPLEAGLRGAVSFTKGCYVGQEVVARLNTYDKVARTLVTLELEPGAPVPARGAAVVLGGTVIGEVTSALRPPGRRAPVALAYVKLRELPAEPAGLAIDDRGSVHGATLIGRYRSASR
jgi:folate-binding protein YgfZ